MNDNREEVIEYAAAMVRGAKSSKTRLAVRALENEAVRRGCADGPVQIGNDLWVFHARGRGTRIWRREPSPEEIRSVLAGASPTPTRAPTPKTTNMTAPPSAGAVRVARLLAGAS